MKNRFLAAALPAVLALAVLTPTPSGLGAARGGSGVAVRPFAPEAPLAESLAGSLLAELSADAPDLGPALAGAVGSAEPRLRADGARVGPREVRNPHSAPSHRGFPARPTRAPPVLSL